MKSIQKLPDSYQLPRGARQIRVGRAQDELVATPLPWPCPVCGGISGDGRKTVTAILEVTYPNGREERFIVTAHERCL
jgi:hypothetical protein